MRRLLLFLVVAGLALAAFGFWGARQQPQVVRYTLEVPGLAAPLRIVQLSDTHVGSIAMPAARLREIVWQANTLNPDLVVLTGDYVNGNPETWNAAQTRAALAPFDALQAPFGVFAVNGNHDDPARTAKALAAGPVRLLVGEAADVGPVTLVGADDIERGSPAVEAMRRAIRGASPGKPIVVIAHEPSFFTWLQRRPVVMIAGHTHGGQIKLPIVGAYAMNEFYAAHRRGVFRKGRHQKVVSSGLGTTNVPMRIGVPPEIALITLLPVQPGRNSGTER